jgi:hypothetical protein
MPYKQKFPIGKTVIRKSDSISYDIEFFNKKTGVYYCFNQYYGYVELYEKDFFIKR